MQRSSLRPVRRHVSGPVPTNLKSLWERGLDYSNRCCRHVTHSYWSAPDPRYITEHFLYWWRWGGT